MSTLIFDFDGTICDDLDEAYSILGTLAAKYGFKSPSSFELEHLRGMTARQLIHDLEVPLVKVPMVLKTAKAELKKRIRELKPIKGLPEILHELQSHYRLGILTSNSQENVDAFLEHNQMRGLFEFVHTGSSLFGKGRVLKALLKRIKLAKKEAIYVGDEMRDIEASREAGVRVISVSWGFNSKNRLEGENPDYLIDSPAELRNAVRVLNQLVD